MTKYSAINYFEQLFDEWSDNEKQNVLENCLHGMKDRILNTNRKSISIKKIIKEELLKFKNLNIPDEKEVLKAWNAWIRKIKKIKIRKKIKESEIYKKLKELKKLKKQYQNQVNADFFQKYLSLNHKS